MHVCVCGMLAMEVGHRNLKTSTSKKWPTKWVCNKSTLLRHKSLHVSNGSWTSRLRHPLQKSGQRNGYVTKVLCLDTSHSIAGTPCRNEYIYIYGQWQEINIRGKLGSLVYRCKFWVFTEVSESGRSF